MADHTNILRTYGPQLSAIWAGMANSDVAVRLVGTAFLFGSCVDHQTLWDALRCGDLLTS